MNTKEGCHLGIIKQFLQHFYILMNAKIISLMKILSEVHKSQKLQARIIPPETKHNLGAVDYFSGNLRFNREISLQINNIFGSDFGNTEFKSISMQFQELIQSSLTKHVNTALKYFLRSKTDVLKHC